MNKPNQTLYYQGHHVYPSHTGSVLLDIAQGQRDELLATASERRRVRAVRTGAPKPTTRPPRRPWWWGLARRSHTA